MCRARQTKVLPAAGAKLPLMGGATHRLVEDAQNGLAAGVLAAPPADGELTDAALFIDQSAGELGPVAAVKWGWGCGLPCGGRGSPCMRGRTQPARVCQ